MIEPTSGNVVPPGALPEEVKDDQPIMASAGEYIIPASVVRYLGLEKIEAMVNKAKEGLKEKAAQGRIGGQPMGPPSRGPEQSKPPVAPVSRPPMGRPPGMAEGGLVSSSTPAAPKMVKFSSPDGKNVFIPFVNGNAIIPIPQGYTQAAVEAQPAATSTAVAPKPQGYTKLEGVGGIAEQGNPISEWGVDDFVSLGTQLTNPVGQGFQRLANAVIPFGKVFSTLANNYMEDNVPGRLDSMIETGMSPEGAALTEDELKGLMNTREVLRDRMSEETGQSGNPFESIGGFFNRLIGRDTPSAPTSGSPSPVSGVSKGTGSQSSPNSGNGSTFSDPKEGSFFNQADNPTQKPEGYDKPAPGPKFAKGGLVTRRC